MTDETQPLHAADSAGAAQPAPTPAFAPEMASQPAPIAFSAQVFAVDPLAASWLAETTLRLRREICWLWRQRGSAARAEHGALPPPVDDLIESLDFTRFEDEKRRFFNNDATALHLDQRIAAVRAARVPAAGPWLTIASRMRLDQGAQFVLALALLAYADPASGVIFAACQNDASRTLPTLALAHRLWGAGVGAHSTRTLAQSGILAAPADAGTAGLGWLQPCEITAHIAEALLHDDGRVPVELALVTAREQLEIPAALARAAELHSGPARETEIVPLIGDAGCDFREWAVALARREQRTLLALRHDVLPEAPKLAALAAWCWLYDADVLLPPQRRAHEHIADRTASWPRVPLRWYAPAHDVAALNALPKSLLSAPLRLPATDFNARVRRFQRVLGARAAGLDAEVREMARRFRLPPAAIDAIGRAASECAELDGPTLHGLCRAQTHANLGTLAQRVEPRFVLADMILPEAQHRQLREIVRAMRALTEVHYRWGTARVWNDAGLSVVFCGPPGTGKTMAAEALAHELELPLFRIDLSQVVDKYIGETEKNLARVFDAAEESDCVIFFDEADALFGKRTSVKDAHDRFANIEVSYLLERMERLKGIAVLATNRRKDLDDAFLRRLRYLIEFPLPEEPERERIWRAVFPAGVDTSAIDFGALARLFPLAGGHIRSIAFNACLQCAHQAAPAVDMPPVLCAVKRELDKLNRPNSPENFGEYRSHVLPLFAPGIV